MKPSLHPYFFKVLMLFFLLFSGGNLYATHFYGIDLRYDHVTGNTYSVTMIVYGDCSGQAFYSLPNSAPVIKVYKANTLFTTITLAIQPPQYGIEVTNVCPAQLGNTQCTNINNPIPGVKKFVYTRNVTLNDTSSYWRFQFLGDLTASFAGRSGSITNVVDPSNTTVELVDTLNNTHGGNSSPVLSTIPTPFYCIQEHINYNSGAVDADTDRLTFFMVTAYNATTGSPVTYINPYTPTAPFAAIPGSFSFDSLSGQLAFTPNALQKSLAVYNIEEHKNNILTGTSQREMTFIVLSCNDTPSYGAITNASAGTIVDDTHFKICQSVGAFTFHIDPTNAEGDSITVTSAGLPAGSSYTLTNNGTPAPLGTFSWNTTGVAPGNYIFYLTFQGNVCPLSTVQTQAYIVTVLPADSVNYIPVSPATCSSEGRFFIAPSGSASPWTVNVINGSDTLQTLNNITGATADSLWPGSYTLHMHNVYDCFSDTSFIITGPPRIIPHVATVSPVCIGDANGTITITATNGNAPPFLYAIDNGAFSPNNIFTGLQAATYTFHIKDTTGCIADTVVTLQDPAPILATYNITLPLCNALQNGSITIAAYNSVAPYQYAVNEGLFSNTNIFTGISTGIDTFHLKNALGCIMDTAIVFVDSVHLSAALQLSGINCFGGLGAISVSASGSVTSLYEYSINGGVLGYSNTFSNLLVGTYSIHISDSLQCFFDTTISLSQPPLLVDTLQVHNNVCYGDMTGSISIIATGGSPSYNYNLNGGSFSGAVTYNTLAAGSYIIGIKDNNNCLLFDTIAVTQPTQLFVDSLNWKAPLCYGNNNGSINIAALNGTPPYTYAYDIGSYQPSGIFSMLPAGQYTVHVKDMNGCIVDTMINLVQPPPLSAFVIDEENPTCEGKKGVVSLTAFGGTDPYYYSIDTGSSGYSNSFTGLNSGTHFIHVIDSNGCKWDTTLTLRSYTDIAIANAGITEPSCYGFTDGVISVKVSGGISPLSFQLFGGNAQSTGMFDSLAKGMYHLTIVDSLNCSLDTTILLQQPDSLIISAAVTPNDCYSTDTISGSVIISATGGTKPYTYYWNIDRPQTDSVITNLSNGIYYARIVDAQKCKDSIQSIVDFDDCCKPYLPNAFTPNGDGKDDIYRIRVKGDMKLLEFSIYNRFGQLLYTTNRVDEGWDGTYNGVKQNMDTYFYYCRIICGENVTRKITLKGDVTLIR